MFSSSLSSLSSLSDEDVAAPRRRRRHQVQILNCFDRYDDEDFRKRFRLRKETVLHLVALFGERLETTTTATRRRAVKPVDQILIALRYFATGTYQRVIGDVFNVDQSTVHRIVHRVAQEIARLKPSYINMPSPQFDSYHISFIHSYPINEYGYPKINNSYIYNLFNHFSLHIQKHS